MFKEIQKKNNQLNHKQTETDIYCRLVCFFIFPKSNGEGKKIISRFPLYTNKSTLNAFLIYDQIIIFR